MAGTIPTISAVNNIQSLNNISLGTDNKTERNNGASFGQVLQQALDNLNQTVQEADSMAQAYAAGEDVEIHDVMIAMQESQLSLDLALQTRNKMVDAYQEIMRMQI